MKFKDLDVYAIGDTIQMAGVIYSGKGKLYICAFPGEEVPTSQYHEVLEMTLDEWQKFLLQTDVLETEIIIRAADGTLAKAFIRKSQRHIDTEMQWAVWRRDGYTCRYCGNAETPLTVDHLVVWEEGGPTIPENLVTACKKCNKTRGNMDYEKWLNHPHYKRSSIGLSHNAKVINLSLLDTLPNIPRYVNKRSR